MIAAVLHAFNEPLEIAELFSPVLQVGQVEVAVKAAGICGAQLGEITGAKGSDPYLPHLLGHEGAGVVVGIGEGVSSVSPGDHVVLHWRKGAGIEAPAPKFIRPSGGRVGAGPVSTWAQRAVVSENRCTKIDKDVPFDLAALLGCAVTTGLGLVNNEAALRPGQSILVFGVGGVGLNVVQGAAMVTAHPIVAVDVCPKKLGLAKEFGADFLLLSKDLDDSNLLSITLGGKGYDVVVDCTGNPAVIEAGFSLLRTGGKLILVGQPSHDSSLVLKNFRKHYCGKTMLDCQGGLTNPGEDIPRYLSLWRAGLLSLEPLITNFYHLREINRALQDIQEGKVVGRCILTMD